MVEAPAPLDPHKAGTVYGIVTSRSLLKQARRFVPPLMWMLPRPPRAPAFVRAVSSSSWSYCERNK